MSWESDHSFDLIDVRFVIYTICDILLTRVKSRCKHKYKYGIIRLHKVHSKCEGTKKNNQ